jgi:hypothetical protein
LKKKSEGKASRHQSLLPKMSIMKTQTMLKKTLAKMVVTAATVVMLRIVLTTRNPL